MGSVYKLKNRNRWRVDIKMNGRRVRESKYRTKSSANRRLRELEDMSERNLTPLDLNKPIISLLNEYGEHLLSRQYSKRYQDRLNTFNNNFKHYFESENISLIRHINFSVVDNYIKKRSNFDNREPKTINMEVYWLKNLLDYAINLGYINENVARSFKKLKENKKIPRFFSEDELIIIFSNPGPYEKYFMILLHTGLRAGDAANLKWSEVDLINRLIRVTMEKTGINVEIPISDDLFEHLLDFPTQTGNLFNGLETDEKRAKVRNYLEKTLMGSGFDLTKGEGLHKFRHTFASRLIINGTTIKQVSKWLGHKNLSQTLIYTHLGPASDNNDINKINFNPKNLVTITAPNTNPGIKPLTIDISKCRGRDSNPHGLNDRGILRSSTVLPNSHCYSQLRHS